MIELHWGDPKHPRVALVGKVELISPKADPTSVVTANLATAAGKPLADPAPSPKRPCAKPTDPRRSLPTPFMSPRR